MNHWCIRLVPDKGPQKIADLLILSQTCYSLDLGATLHKDVIFNLGFNHNPTYSTLTSSGRIANPLFNSEKTEIGRIAGTFRVMPSVSGLPQFP
jgi:hypothetical protein